MKSLEADLINNYQRDFPLHHHPFKYIAEQHHTDTATVLSRLKQLKKDGVITRVGPVFRPNTIGVSTLAAMKVPANQLESVAEQINQYSEVNHNYEREHEFNLWFVATAPDKQHLTHAIQDMERQTGIAVMCLPLVEEYHIDLGFQMPLQHEHASHVINKHYSSKATVRYSIQPDDHIQQQLIAEIQSGLPLVETPYAEIAKRIDISEQEVIRRIDIMLSAGTIRRLGVIVRHRELGYRANAMVVWDFPDDQVSQWGNQLSQINCITLCYQRPRHLPDWPYNLFTMIHGKDKETVEHAIDELVQKQGLENIPKAILFSKRRFKQRGACYSYAKNQLDSGTSYSKYA